LTYSAYIESFYLCVSLSNAKMRPPLTTNISNVGFHTTTFTISEIQIVHVVDVIISISKPLR